MKEKRYAIVIETELFYARRMDELKGKCWEAEPLFFTEYKY